MITIFSIYIVVMVGLAIHFDSPRSFYFDFSSRIQIMLLWPAYLVIGLAMWGLLELIIFTLDSTRRKYE